MTSPAASFRRHVAVERLALALCAAAIGVALWSCLCATPAYDWNAARIMPAFVLAAGKKIYFAAGAGPALGWIYGPVMPVLMMPAALLPTLTSAMLAAAVINATLLLGPLLCGVNAAAKRLGLDAGARAWLLIACAGGAVATPWIANEFVFITADNVVVGLVLWSCICLARDEENVRFAWLSAVLVALAVWTKQLAIGAPAAQVLWLWATAGHRRALRQAGRLLIAGVALAGICVAIFGWRELLFNLWTVPSHHPLKGGAGFWFGQLGTLALACLPWVAGFFALRFGSGAAGRTGIRGTASLVAVVGLIQLPLGALGASKIGGGENSFHAIYYFVAAAWLQLAEAGAAPAAFLRRHLAVLAAIASLAGCGVAFAHAGWRLTPAVELEASRTLAAAHPGEILFPRNPLVTWWTERKIYHLEYGYFDQALAGFPPTSERLAAWTPPRLRYIVYQDAPVDHPFARLLPGFERTVRGPGFVIHVATPPASQ